jgi:hypothetical protein
MTREETHRRFLDRIGTKLGKVAAPGGSSISPARLTPDTCVGLAILIDFPDKPSDIPRDSIVDFLNMPGYTGYRNKGSIFEYYYDISDGKMVYTNFVTQFITADNKKKYYDAGTGYAGTYALLDEIGAKMQNMKIDLSSVTLSGNYIKATNVYYAGSPQAGWANGLWPNSGYRRVRSGATNGMSAKEAFYIEARRKEGWSQGLPDEGLLIWHVDKICSMYLTSCAKSAAFW